MGMFVASSALPIVPLEFIGEFAPNSDTLKNIDTTRQRMFFISTTNASGEVSIYAGNNLVDRLLSIDTTAAGGTMASMGTITYFPTSDLLAGCGIGKNGAGTAIPTGQSFAATTSLRVVVSNSAGFKVCIYASVVR